MNSLKNYVLKSNNNNQCLSVNVKRQEMKVQVHFQQGNCFHYRQRQAVIDKGAEVLEDVQHETPHAMTKAKSAWPSQTTGIRKGGILRLETLGELKVHTSNLSSFPFC